MELSPAGQGGRNAVKGGRERPAPAAAVRWRDGRRTSAERVSLSRLLNNSTKSYVPGGFGPGGAAPVPAAGCVVGGDLEASDPKRPAGWMVD